MDNLPDPALETNPLNTRVSGNDAATQGQELAVKLEHDWQLATSVFPDLDDLCETIAHLSKPAALEFKNGLLASRSFGTRADQADRNVSQLLEQQFGSSEELMCYARALLQAKAFAALEYLSECVRVIGADTHIELFKRAVRHRFPDLPDGSELNVLHRTLPAGPANLLTVQSSATTVDTLSRVKASRLGRIYLRYFKRFDIVRAAAFKAWRAGYPVYMTRVEPLFRRFHRAPWVRTEALSRYLERNGLPRTTLSHDTLTLTPVPQAFPASTRENLKPPHTEFSFPGIYVATVTDAKVLGGTNLVFKDDFAICHDLYDFTLDYSSEELHGRVVHDTKSRRLKCLSYDPQPLEMQRAASFLDACAPNYAHWLTEVLPRVAMFCSSELRGDVPLIVNDGLHKNLLESLALVSGTDRKIIALGMERAVHLEELLMTSCAGYVPFERRDARKPGHSHGRFSQIAFSVLRERFIPIAEELGIDRPPRSVYLKRGGAARQILNLDEVETTLLEAGFVTVRPEKLSFVEQVALFSSAEHIVGASGAAMANMIFCKPHARVSICIGIHPDTSYWYWQNMACAAGNSVNYILCRNRPSSNPTIHDDFTVDLSALKDAIQR